MIFLELPGSLKAIRNMTREIAVGMFRPISRKYDTAEHAYPVELDMLRAMIGGMDDGGSQLGASGLSQKKTEKNKKKRQDIRNGKNMGTVLNVMELCWGDVGLMLTIPGQGLGNAAIAAVATPEQKERFGNKWASMAITEPSAGSDSKAITTTADEDGDSYVLNGTKIFVTCGKRADLVVVWATLDKKIGRAAIKPFVVEQGTPGFELVGLEHKLGIRASDTATLRFENCRIPKSNLLGSPEIDVKAGFGGVMQTFDNTRPMVAAMALGVAKAALDRTRTLLEEGGVDLSYPGNRFSGDASAAELHRLEAELESARLLTLKAAWMADNGRPNSMQASMAKAKAGRMVNEVTLRCVELCGPLGYSEVELLEKWARDSKILDIFEGTQQIQQLIIARRLLRKSSSQLK